MPLMPQAVYSPAVSTDGWTTLNETWVYDSADAPTYTFTVSGDKSTVYSPGMKVRLTQATGGTKYGIITAVSYANPTTTVTLYMGTDYSLANEGITGPAYSTHKAPQGFPLDPAKWTVTATDTSDASQASPVTSTWYNLGSISIVVPIGAWNVSWMAEFETSRSAAGSLAMKGTLSTENNTESDNDFTRQTYGNSIANIGGSHHVEKPLVLAAKTTYYLNGSTPSSSMTNIRFRGDLTDTIIRAVCAYL